MEPNCANVFCSSSSERPLAMPPQYTVQLVGLDWLYTSSKVKGLEFAAKTKMSHSVKLTKGGKLHSTRPDSISKNHLPKPCIDIESQRQSTSFFQKVALGRKLSDHFSIRLKTSLFGVLTQFLHI